MKVSDKKCRYQLLCGVLGCLLMAAGDWLMIWGDTTYNGALSWLTVGAGSVPAWRNNLALALSFPAVALYAAALFGLRSRIVGERQAKTYGVLTAYGMMPWLCLHLFYTMILFLFHWSVENGQEALGLAAGEALFAHYSWIVFVADGIMLLPFLYWLLLSAAGKTAYPRWTAVSNPLTWFVVLKLLTALLPDSAFRLSFTNGLMSEAMLLWFLVLLLIR